MIPEEILVRLARETATTLAELGVRQSDGGWIASHARSIAELARPVRERRGRLARLYRRARRAARTVR